MMNKYDNIKNNLNNIYEKNNNKILTIIYKINNYQNNSKIKLFGEIFVNNNKFNCNLIINNKKNELCEYYYFDKKERKKKLIIKLLITKEINNMSYMFSGCEDLISLYNISK